MFRVFHEYQWEMDGLVMGDWDMAIIFTQISEIVKQRLQVCGSNSYSTHMYLCSVHLWIDA